MQINSIIKISSLDHSISCPVVTNFFTPIALLKLECVGKWITGKAKPTQTKWMN